MEQTVQSPSTRPEAAWRIGDVFVLRHAGMPFEWIESLRVERLPATWRAVRALARRLGLPRFVFARFAGERKPYLFDTHSPFGADLVCHAARNGSSVVLEEMCPGPRELWRRDEEGSYTCELRMQAERATPYA